MSSVSIKPNIKQKHHGAGLFRRIHFRLQHAAFLLTIQNHEIMYYVRRGARFPQELVKEISRASAESAEQSIPPEDFEPYFFVVFHEKQRSREDSEFIVQGVFHILDSANN